MLVVSIVARTTLYMLEYLLAEKMDHPVALVSRLHPKSFRLSESLTRLP
jgi:hypothetical protein